MSDEEVKQTVATLKSSMVLNGLSDVWAVGNRGQLEKAVAKTLALSNGEKVRITAVKTLAADDGTSQSSLRKLKEWINYAAASLEKLRRRKLQSDNELQIDFTVPLKKESDEKMAEMKLMLLAAGASSITTTFAAELAS